MEDSVLLSIQKLCADEMNSHFCNRVALNLDILLGGSWGASGPTSSSFLSGIVGKAGGAMVRCGMQQGRGSFSITVPVKA